MFVNFYNSIWYLCHLARKFISIIWKNFIYCHSQKLCIFFASKLNGLISHFMASHTSKNSLSFFLQIVLYLPTFCTLFYGYSKNRIGKCSRNSYDWKVIPVFSGTAGKKTKFSVLIKFIYVFDLR